MEDFFITFLKVVDPLNVIVEYIIHVDRRNSFICLHPHVVSLLFIAICAYYKYQVNDIV